MSTFTSRQVTAADLEPLVGIGTLPAPADLSLYRGDDFLLDVTITLPDGTTPADLTGATFKAEVRQTHDDESVAGAFVMLSVAANVVHLRLPGSVTAELPASGVWDFQVTGPDTYIATLLAGSVTVAPEVTRP